MDDQRILSDIEIGLALGPPGDPDPEDAPVEYATWVHVTDTCQEEFGFRPMNPEREAFYRVLGEQLALSCYPEDHVIGVKMVLKAEHDGMARQAVEKGDLGLFLGDEPRLVVAELLAYFGEELSLAIREEYSDPMTALRSDTFIPPRH